jgi:hypothetical protein
MADELPPFSLKEAEKWLHWLEDVATIERDSGFASRLILGNLLIDLHKAGVIDGKRLLEHIIGAVDLIPEKNYQLATRLEAQHLQQELGGMSVEPYMPSKLVH